MKQCSSLAVSGFSVHLIVADGNGNEQVGSVNIIDVGSHIGRLNRILKAPKKVLSAAKNVDADVYHLHDPELIPIGLKLKRLGKVVFFDAHEDVPVQILSKPYLKKPVRQMLSLLFRLYEKSATKRLDGVVAATPYIRRKFASFLPNVIDINNFPIISELVSTGNAKTSKSICYIGGLERARGIKEICLATSVSEHDITLELAGSFSSEDFETEIKSLSEWRNVKFHGWLDREGIKNLLGSSVAGLVTLHPIPNYLDALPVKMFEYMAAGIPVIASNFPLWKDIIETHQCGICVDPLNPSEIARACERLIADPELAIEMGKNGARAVVDVFNWDVEKQKLIDFYLARSGSL